MSLDEIYTGTLDCVHCGLCLTSCPTYLATGRETSSPRGRVYLMRGAAEGRIELGGVLAEEAELCLGCRACETACPAGVPYGAMLEETRQVLRQAGSRNAFAARLERWLLRHVVSHRGRLRVLSTLTRVAQRLGLVRAASRWMPAGFANAARLLPELRGDRSPLPERIAAQGERRGVVAFFTGCLMPEFFSHVQQATV